MQDSLRDALCALKTKDRQGTRIREISSLSFVTVKCQIWTDHKVRVRHTHITMSTSGGCVWGWLGVCPVFWDDKQGVTETI